MLCGDAGAAQPDEVVTLVQIAGKGRSHRGGTSSMARLIQTQWFPDLLPG